MTVSTLFQFPCPWTPSHSYNLPLLSHWCHLDQTVWCQLPTSPALWPMRAPSSGSGPSHLGSTSPRCGSLMGQEPALCRYLRSLLPMQGSTHAQQVSVGSLLIGLLLFNSIVSSTNCSTCYIGYSVLSRCRNVSVIFQHNSNH